MKIKLLNALLIITSLAGYLEWGGDNSSFLIEAEFDIIRGLFTDFSSAAHPFTLIPLFGQIALAFSLFQKVPNKVLTAIGISSLGLLLSFVFVIGLMALNMKVLISTLPFLVVAVLAIRQMRLKHPSSK